MNRIITSTLIIILVSGILFSCQPGTAWRNPVNEGWQSSDLRYITIPSTPSTPGNIVAVYVRENRPDLEIRLDFFDLREMLSIDVYAAIQFTNYEAKGLTSQLPINANPQLNWDWLISCRNSDSPHIEDKVGTILGNIRPRIIRDPVLQADILILNTANIPTDWHQWTIQIYVTPANSQEPIDITEPIQFNANPPEPANLLIEFWNVFDVYTPAQALRRWDGAHTGPYGQRHGLKYLLQASDQYGIPISLLDLKMPNSLSGLDLVGAIPMIKRMVGRGLLLLPDVAYGSPLYANKALELSQASSSSYGFSQSNYRYGPFLVNGLEKEKIYFTDSPQINEIQLTQDNPLIPTGKSKFTEDPIIHLELDDPNNTDGIPPHLKLQLLQIAQEKNPERIMFFGQSLPSSPWADVTIAGPAFQYIANHPWIHPINSSELLRTIAQRTFALKATGCSDLLCSPAPPPTIPISNDGQPIPSNTTLTELANSMFDQLITLPARQASDTAWQMFMRINTMMENPQSSGLKANYLGQVGYLIYAAKWSMHPISISDCSDDLNYDGAADCILSNGLILTILNPQGGRLLYAGMMTPTGLQQWIGPSSELAVGLGNPNDWNLASGEFADPLAIPGAFIDHDNRNTQFTPSTFPTKIVFTNQESRIQKLYELVGNSIRVSWNSERPISTTLPLVLLPSENAGIGWLRNYHSSVAKDHSAVTWSASLNSSILVSIEGGILQSKSFVDTLSDLTGPELPDKSYPAGHYLPFPLEIIEITSSGAFSVVIQPSISPQ